MIKENELLYNINSLMTKSNIQIENSPYKLFRKDLKNNFVSCMNTDRHQIEDLWNQCPQDLKLVYEQTLKRNKLKYI